VGTLGAALESHPRFTRRVNVGFRQMINAAQLRLRVFERGVGETQACGTGACAAVATGIRDGLLERRVQVDLPGGTLFVSWEGPGNRLWLEGPAEVSFTGQFEL
jgi:diaminopimelate epimerase